jgi:integrase
VQRWRSPYRVAPLRCSRAIGARGEKPLWRHTAKLLRARTCACAATPARTSSLGREGPLKKRQIQNLFRHYVKLAGLDNYSVHALRHSIAVHLLDAGRGIEFISDHLGHRNIQKHAHLWANLESLTRANVSRLGATSKIIRL